MVIRDKIRVWFRLAQIDHNGDALIVKPHLSAAVKDHHLFVICTLIVITIVI